MSTNSNEQVALTAGAIEAIRKLAVDAAQVTFHKVGNTEFIINKDGDAEALEPIIYRPSSLRLGSLDALVQLVKTEAVPNYTASTIYVSASSATGVDCFLQPSPEDSMHRCVLYTAEARDVPGFRNRDWTFEEAMIGLRSQFQPTEDIAYMLDLLSHMSVDQNVQSDDNGVTQTVQVKQGISFVANETVRPIVTLAPYRTFQEVDQPASQFVFRVDNKRNIMLAEADGGMWKLAARRTVKQYLCDELAEEIAAGRVIVTL